MTQLTFLPTEPRPGTVAHNHTATSIAAADSIRESVSQLQAKVLSELKRRGDYGATRDELSLALSMLGNTLRPRVKELLDKGLIVETNERRQTASGRMAVVLKLKG